MTRNFESDVVGPRTPVVREATPEDQEQVDALLRGAFGRRDEARREPDAGSEQEGGTGRPAGRTLVAVEPDHAPGEAMHTRAAGRVVGYLRLEPAEADGVPALAVSTLAVLPERQGRGIATYLLQFALETVGDTEGTPVVLSDAAARYDGKLWGAVGLHGRADSGRSG